MAVRRTLAKTGKYLRSRRSEAAIQTQPEKKPTPNSQGTTGGPTLWMNSKVLPLFLSWSQPFRKYNTSECFFPFPKITVLIDRPRGLKCQICREAEWEIMPDDSNVEDSTFSIMPCGHAAGSQCLGSWLEANKSCPFCRLSLRYPGCGHAISPRPLTQASIHLMPATLPDGGHIPQVCQECHQHRLYEEVNPRCRVAAGLFRNARRRYYHTKQSADGEALLKRREELETVIYDEVYQRHVAIWLSSW